MKRMEEISDYPVFKKLASALWQRELSFHGAAIMVGAGFSRATAQSGDGLNKLPLWWDYAKILQDELNSKVEDPLRLAEEYHAFFGKEALHDLIRQKLNDSAWFPGELSTELLKLPWVEVLTTNWDTLLERASQKIYQPSYSLVTKQEDLSSSLSPRIVKLHGTVNVSKDLIFTQEDFRRYPQEYAAFVNFARQVFIENELCLLGFSGEDPNFLQWAGWVRDNLAGHSRRIYLVGALNLSSSRRKYLESINIAPIDLFELVKDYDEDLQHFYATKIFIEELKNHKPKNNSGWFPDVFKNPFINSTKNEQVFQVKELKEEIQFLKNNRESYPGWLICPEYVKSFITEQVAGLTSRYKHLCLEHKDKYTKLLYEIAWRYQISFQLPDLELFNSLLDICDPSIINGLNNKQKIDIAIYLMSTLHFNYLDPSVQLEAEQKLIKILEQSVSLYPDAENELFYYYALKYRDTLNYSEFKLNSNKIQPMTPEWKVRKSSLLIELGQIKETEILLREAYLERRNHLKHQPNSIYILSRLAWIQFFYYNSYRLRGELLSEQESFLNKIQFMGVEPTNELENIKKGLSKTIEQQQKNKYVKILFEPGKYTVGKNITFSDGSPTWVRAISIANYIGIPMHLSDGIKIDIFSEIASLITNIENIPTRQKMVLSIRASDSNSSDIIIKTLSRVRIAELSEEDVNFLISSCDSGIDFWCAEFTNHNKISLDYLRVLLEVLARVSIRASPEKAKHIFRKACNLAKLPNLRHMWLYEPLGNLVNYSLSAIRTEEKPDILKEILTFPLPQDMQNDHFNKWPNPVIEDLKFYKRDYTDNQLTQCIYELINKIKVPDIESANILERLYPLIITNNLSSSEIERIQFKIWGQKPDYSVVPEVGYYSHALLKLPNYNKEKVEELVKRELYEATDFLELSRLISIASLGVATNQSIFPSREQALVIFEQIVVWRYSNTEITHPFDRTSEEEKEKAKWVGYTLSQSILPVFQPEDLSESNFEKLLAFYTETHSLYVLPAFIYFAVQHEVFVGNVENLLKANLFSLESEQVYNAARAVFKWREIQQSPILDKLISRVIYSLNLKLENSLGILFIVNKLYESNYLSEQDIDLLTDLLPLIFDSSDYSLADEQDSKTGEISLRRKQIANIVDLIVNRNPDYKDKVSYILEEVAVDPLPEVRYWKD